MFCNKRHDQVPMGIYSTNEVELKTFKDGMAGMNHGWGGTSKQLTNYLDKTQEKTK